MYKNKGFSLIELMIVVAIIGILSLISLPMYKNYVERVRLTEIIHLTRQLETEFNIGGAEAVYNYVKGTCSSDITIAGSILICNTNIGLMSARATVTYCSTCSSNNGTQIILMPPTDRPDTDYNIQSISFLEGRADESILYHFPKNSRSGDQPVGQRSGYAFSFVQQREGIDDSNKLRITKEDLSTYFADFNRWYCGGIILNNTGAELGGPIPKAIRPRMCNFTTPDAYNLTNFLED